MLRAVVARTLVSITLGFAAMLFCSAAAATPNVRLSYSEGPGVSGCPPERTLRNAVVSRLGEDPFAPGGTRVFEARIRVQGRALEGVVRLVDEQGNHAGHRRFESSHAECAELIQALALAISLAINPNLASTEESAISPADDPPRASPSADRTASEPTSVSRPPQPAAEQAPASERQEGSPWPWRFTLGAAVNGAVGAGPEPAVGALAFGRIRRRYASVALEVRYDAPFEHAVGADSVHSSMWAGAIAPCLHLAFARGCGLLLAGDVGAGSHGVDAPQNPHALFLASGLRAGVEWPVIARLGFTAQLDGLLTLKPVRIVLDGRPVWTTPLASSALAVGAVWQIP
jgi:hypothetical protein